MFLLIYFASVSVLTLYWVVIFNRTTADANGINTWYWACMSVMLVVFGVLSRPGPGPQALHARRGGGRPSS